MKKMIPLITFFALMQSACAQFEGVLVYHYGIGTSINYIRDNWSFIQFAQKDHDTLMFWYDSQTMTLYTKTEKNSEIVYKNDVSENSILLDFEPLNVPAEIHNHYTCLQGKLVENSSQSGQSGIHVWYMPGASEPAALVGLFKNVPGIPVYVTQNGNVICELMGIKKTKVDQELFNLSQYSIVEINDEYIDINSIDLND
jgi:hypothetical protein